MTQLISEISRIAVSVLSAMANSVIDLRSKDGKSLEIGTFRTS